MQAQFLDPHLAALSSSTSSTAQKRILSFAWGKDFPNETNNEHAAWFSSNKPDYNARTIAAAEGAVERASLSPGLKQKADIICKGFSFRIRNMFTLSSVWDSSTKK